MNSLFKLLTARSSPERAVAEHVDALPDDVPLEQRKELLSRLVAQNRFLTGVVLEAVESEFAAADFPARKTAVAASAVCGDQQALRRTVTFFPQPPPPIGGDIRFRGF